MSQDNKDMLYDLLGKKAVYGLDAEEQRQLDELGGGRADEDLLTLELTAAAINLGASTDDEPLPAHVYEKISADAANYVGPNATEQSAEPWPPVTKGSEMFAEKPRRSLFGWLGWAAAAAACVALAVNIYLTRSPGPEVKVITPTAATPRPLSPGEQMTAFESSTPHLLRASWAPGNVRDIKQITGDVVWSDEKQTGYLRIRGLPIKGAPGYCYQLWIFDKVQDKATPIDGGIFDVDHDGEIIVPITTKIPASGPTMFALTIERHGGVVVSKREQIAAVAKVENQPG
jgi:hypothetical protein